MVEIYPPSYAYNSVSTIPEDSPVEDVSRVAAATVAARVLMGNNTPSAQQDTNSNDNKMTREEHAAMMQELSKKRAGWRTPRRGWSSTDAPVAVPPVPEPAPSQHTPSAPSPLADHQEPSSPAAEKPSPPRQSQPPISGARRRQVEEAYRVSSAVPEQQQQQQQQQQNATASVALRPRPPMPPPRRSYSVTDHEPLVLQTHRPSVRLNIFDLPGELHFAVFDFLDPIDSTCLGLTNSHFYDIHRRMHGSVPLSSRREGPNDLEWAWRAAGPLVHPQPAPQQQQQPQARSKDSSTKSSDTDEPTAPMLLRSNTSPAVAAQPQDQTSQPLERLRVKGQVYCRKCGISRCELHRHLKEWMVHAGRARYEYCSVSCKYGPPAPEGAKEFCHLKSPKKPHRCGRHAPAPNRPVAASAAVGDVQSRIRSTEA